MTGWRDVVTALVRAHRPLVALDFDGTLASITADPSRASIAPDLLDDLNGLARTLRIAIVSGRPRSFLTDQLGDLAVRIEIASNYGRDETATPADRDLLDRVARDLADLAADGALIERKPTSVALHVREHPELADRAAVTVQRLAAAYHLDLQEARQAYELLLPSSATKGTAVLSLITDDTDFVLYAGDDVGDIAAIEAVRGHGGPSWCLAIDSGELPPALAAISDEVIDQPELHRRLHSLRELLAPRHADHDGPVDDFAQRSREADR